MKIIKKLNTNKQSKKNNKINFYNIKIIQIIMKAYFWDNL